MPAIVPPDFLRCMSAADRKTFALGQFTPEEAISKTEVKEEKQLQSLLVGLLRLRGLEPLWFRTDKRSRATVGWPDITFAVSGHACAWEAKLPGQKPRSEQVAVHCRMIKNGWTVDVVTSVDQGRKLLDEYGTQAATGE